MTRVSSSRTTVSSWIISSRFRLDYNIVALLKLEHVMAGIYMYIYTPRLVRRREAQGEVNSHERQLGDNVYCGV
jgi:hypothetical protein